MSANEQRVRLAMEDFDSAVRDGFEVEDAIVIAATENDLPQYVVRARGEKAFGDLQLYRARCLQSQAAVAERRAKLQPLADFIDSVYAKAKGPALLFIPIGNFIRANFPEGLARDEAFAFSRDYQKKCKKHA